MKAQYKATCGSCGGLVQEGEEIHYYPPSGEYQATVTHITCPPEQKRRTVRPRDTSRRGMAEDRFAFFECVECGASFSSPHGELPGLCVAYGRDSEKCGGQLERYD